jgi:predicted site-specific integrase-resolvase
MRRRRPLAMTDELEKVLHKCPAGLAARLIGVSMSTLHNWRRDGRIKTGKSPTGRFTYDVTPWVKPGEKAKVA